MPHRIDKDTFLAARTCRTQGWYVFRAATETPSPATAWRMWTGQELHRIARDQLGARTVLPRVPEEAAIAATAEAIRDPATSVVCEATFLSGDFVARADFLRRNGDRWDLIEVKSGKEPEDKLTRKGIKKGPPNSEYLQDLAYTAFVAKGAEVAIARCLLMLVSRQYRYGSSNNILVELDVTVEVAALIEAYRAEGESISRAVLAAERPVPELIFACRSCPYFDEVCLGVGVVDPVFDLPRLNEKRFGDLKQFARIAGLPDDCELTPLQQRTAAVIKSGKPLVVPDGLALLDLINWPVHYLDFESIAPALPWFDGTGPYDAIPFQYSVHVKASSEEPASHFEYLAPAAGDWRRELAENLITLLGTQGSILMYSAYEKRMLGYLADSLPDLAPSIEAIKLRLFDLEAVIEAGYCHPAFRGHTSIKNVLPVMVPDLSYKGLPVRGGDDAAGTFALMYRDRVPIERHGVDRRALLEYCKLDTLAMVRVHEELLKIRVGTSN